MRGKSSLYQITQFARGDELSLWKRKLVTREGLSVRQHRECVAFIGMYTGLISITRNVEGQRSMAKWAVVGDITVQ